MMTSIARRIAESRFFNNFILAVIIGAGVTVGVQTYVQVTNPLHHTLEQIDFIILLIFTVEIVIKMMAEAPKPLNYFKDPWNIFDFVIVAVCWLAHLIPAMDAGYIAVIRLARVLRVMRLVQTLPELKMLINAMLKSIPSMGYVGVMLLLLY
jgi:voltage-gated sodium channel